MLFSKKIKIVISVFIASLLLIVINEPDFSDFEQRASDITQKYMTYPKSRDLDLEKMENEIIAGNEDSNYRDIVCEVMLNDSSYSNATKIDFIALVLRGNKGFDISSCRTGVNKFVRFSSKSSSLFYQLPRFVAGDRVDMVGIYIDVLSAEKVIATFPDILIYAAFYKSCNTLDLLLDGIDFKVDGRMAEYFDQQCGLKQE